MQIPLKMAMRQFSGGGVSFAVQMHSSADLETTCRSLIQEIPRNNMDTEDVISCVMSSLRNTKSPVDKTKIARLLEPYRHKKPGELIPVLRRLLKEFAGRQSGMSFESQRTQRDYKKAMRLLEDMAKTCRTARLNIGELGIDATALISTEGGRGSASPDAIRIDERIDKIEKFLEEIKGYIKREYQACKEAAR